jgi:MFS family permease
MATRGLLLALGPAAAFGLGRFAYALVLPLMQAAWGLSYAEGGLLGSANTLGYLLGALLTGPLWGPWVEGWGEEEGFSTSSWCSSWEASRPWPCAFRP